MAKVHTNLVFFLKNYATNLRKPEKMVEKTKSTGAGIRTHALRTVSHRANDLTTKDC